MEILHAAVAILVLVCVCFFKKFPYFLHDCVFIVKSLRVRSKRMKFRQKVPYYTVLDCFLDAVRRHPNKPFIVFQDHVYTYLQVERWSNRAARALREHARLREGDTAAVCIGITVVLRRKFSVSQFWNDCRKHNVTVIQYIGEIMRYLCNTPERETDRQHSVRMAIGNGLRADVWQEFQHRFGVKHVKEFYGASDGNIGFMNYVGKVGAIGKVNFLQRKLNPHTLIRYDAELEEPVRDSRGRCVPVPTGETGLLVCKITESTPFAGYAGNPEQTEKKKLKNVFEDGDVYLNSGDLLRRDEHGFVYFQDRVGDTFRWKGENVATTEVSDVMLLLDCVEEVNVYGVEVPGHEGRVGMAALTIKEKREFDCNKAFSHVTNFLPAYARPRFIRILRNMALTGTFKLVKTTLMKDGFDPDTVTPPLYLLQESSESYVPLTHTHYNAIISGKICF